MVEEKIFTIPLRKAFRKSDTKRTPYAMRLIEDYLRRHCKKNEIKIGKHLNEAIWEKGIKKPPRRVRVKAMINDVVKAELLGFEYEEFVAKKTAKKEKLMDRLRARVGEKALKKEEEEKLAKGEKIEVKEERKEVNVEEVKKEEPEKTK